MFPMKVQPNRASCLPTCLASLLDVPVQQIFDDIGHDGTERIWPGLVEPRCYRGFHPQEIMISAYNHGLPLIRLHRETYNVSAPGQTPHRLTYVLSDIILTHKGIASGILDYKSSHALVFDNGVFYCPTIGKEIKPVTFDLDYILVIPNQIFREIGLDKS